MQIEKKKRELEGAYVLNPANYKKFMLVCGYFTQLAEKNGGKVDFVDSEPDSMHNGIVVKLPMIDFRHESLEKFTDILNMTDVFGITPTASGEISLDVTVNDVWVVIPK